MCLLHQEGKEKASRPPRRLSSRIPSQSKGAGLGKIGRIVFFPCGDEVFNPYHPSLALVRSDVYQGLSRFDRPTNNSDALQPWAKAGLAVETPTEDDRGITFQLEWGTKQFNAFLCNLFPQLFDYLGTTNPGFVTLPDEPDIVGKRRVEYSLPYVLLFKVRKNYSVVDATRT